MLIKCIILHRTRGNSKSSNLIFVLHIHCFIRNEKTDLDFIYHHIQSALIFINDFMKLTDIIW